MRRNFRRSRQPDRYLALSSGLSHVETRVNGRGPLLYHCLMGYIASFYRPWDCPNADC